MPFDIIGDIHGQADALHRLLRWMGYSQQGGTWKHAERTAVFVGDYIDAGPQQLAAVTTVRRMVDEGAAYALMGNHEFNAICWFTRDPETPDDFLRSRFSTEWGGKNRKQHQAFLTDFETHEDLHRETVEWFLTLPLWFESEGLRVVHACWDEQAIATLANWLGSSKRLAAQWITEASRQGTELNAAVERVLKGQEIGLPNGTYFHDAYGIRRNQVRRRWWDANAVTYRQAALLPEPQANQLPDDPLPVSAFFPVNYFRTTLFGHYCLTDCSPWLSSRFGCVDTCAAKGNKLTAYRWDGETTLDPAKFNSVPV
jgi:hypothetical protein